MHAQGRHDDALAIAETIVALSPVALDLRIRCCGARALALSSAGRLDEAEALARDAVALGRKSDFLNFRGDSLVDLAEILERVGRPGEAVAPLREAIGLYERKGNVVSAAKAAARLEQLQGA